MNRMESLLSFAAIAMIVAFLPTACSTTSVSTEVDKGADLSKYSTFQVLPSQSIKDPTIAELVGLVIGDQLATKGLEEAASWPDLMVTFDGWVAGREQMATRLGYAVETVNGETTVYTVSRGVSVGTLLVSLIDRRTGTVVWKGDVQAGLEKNRQPEERLKRLEATVSKLFASFPVKR